MRIYLMRHGETDWNREGRLQGRMDIAMNATGIRQMQEAGAGLRDRGISFDKILASPLRRAVESAEIIASGIGYCRDDIVIEPLLTERSFGTAEGVTYQKRHERSDKEWGMEIVEALCCRALKGINRHIQADRGKGILVVAHGAVLKAAIVALTKGKLGFNDSLVKIVQGNVLLLEYVAEKTMEIYQVYPDHTDIIYINL